MAEIKGNIFKRRGGKFGAHMKNAWQSRSFELIDGTLCYYDSAKRSKPRGKMCLREASLVMYTTYENAPPYSYSFEIVPIGKDEKWRLCAATQREMVMWCDSIKKYVADTTDLSLAQVRGSKQNEITGFLLKRRGGLFGSHMKNAWQGRYFEIKAGVISYYEDEGEIVKPRGQLRLNDAEVSLLMNTTYEQAAPTSFTFELAPVAKPGQSNAEERWLLCASTEEEMLAWCNCIKACLNELETKSKEGEPFVEKVENSSGNQSFVYGGDDVVMSLAWQRRSARTKSGVDRVACEAAARAALEQEKEMQGQGLKKDVKKDRTFEFDILELADDDDDNYRDAAEFGKDRLNPSEKEHSSIEASVSKRQNANRRAEDTFHSSSNSLDLARRWVSKRKTELSHMITDINSNNPGREDDGIDRAAYLDAEPLETEGTYCV